MSEELDFASISNNTNLMFLLRVACIKYFISSILLNFNSGAKSSSEGLKNYLTEKFPTKIAKISFHDLNSQVLGSPNQ